MWISEIECKQHVGFVHIRCLGSGRVAARRVKRARVNLTKNNFIHEALSENMLISEIKSRFRIHSLFWVWARRGATRQACQS